MVQLTKGRMSLSLTLHTDPDRLSPGTSTYELLLESEATRQSKQPVIQNPSWDGRVLTGVVDVNAFPNEDLSLGRVLLQEPNFPAGFYVATIFAKQSDDKLVEVGRSRANLERTSTEAGYAVYQAENASNDDTIKFYEQ